MEFPSPVKRAALYLSCANSTCIFPSLVFALAAKISKITIVLSMILHCNSLSRLLICDGDNSSSQTIPVAPYPSIIITVPKTSAPAVFTSSFNSSKESSVSSFSLVCTPTKITFSCSSFNSYNSINLSYLFFKTNS